MEYRVKQVNKNVSAPRQRGAGTNALWRSDLYKRGGARNRVIASIAAIGVILGTVPLFMGFEAHVLNVTANIKPRECRVANFDFDAAGMAIATGQQIDDEYDPWGLLISADNAHAGIPDLAIAFPSDAPTGGDIDLGTPNEDFAGPGVGVGGETGQAGENKREESNLLVIAEDNVDSNNDGNIDDPTDERDGGDLIFKFAGPTRVESLRLVDIETAGAGSSILLYDNNSVLMDTIPISALGDNSSQYVLLNRTGVKEMRVRLAGEGAVNDLCFDPVEKPQICDPKSKGYWANHEGCDKGGGSSNWTTQVQLLSGGFSSVFATTTGPGICYALWTPNCPHGNSRAARLCKAKTHLLADELNVVSGRLPLAALIAGADDGDSAFNHLGLDGYNTVGEALTVIEAVLASSTASNARITDAGYVAQRIYSFYENGNPFAPRCIFDPDDVPICKAFVGDIKIKNNNDADIENDVEVSANTGGNSANGGGVIVTGDANASSTILNNINDAFNDLFGDSASSSAALVGKAVSSTTEVGSGGEESVISDSSASSTPRGRGGREGRGSRGGGNDDTATSTSPATSTDAASSTSADSNLAPDGGVAPIDENNESSNGSTEGTSDISGADSTNNSGSESDAPPVAAGATDDSTPPEDSDAETLPPPATSNSAPPPPPSDSSPPPEPPLPPPAPEPPPTTEPPLAESQTESQTP